MERLTRSSWFPVGLLLVGGSGLAVSSWMRGSHGKSLQVLVLVTVLALVLLVLASRSDAFRRHAIDPDERLALLGTRAASLAGFVLFWVLFGAFLTEWARGHSGEPYFWLSGLYFCLYCGAAVVEGLRH